MSKVPYTIDVNRYICEELEQIRTMMKTYDFSPLKATVERIQFHANNMESALYSHNDTKRDLRRDVENKKISDAEFRENAKKLLDE